MQLTADEQSLLIVAVLFIGAIGLWAFILHTRGNALLRSLSERIDPALWQELGAPATLQQAVFETGGRWRRFMRSREYRRRCDADTAALIDDYRFRSNRMLVIAGIAAALILIRYWPLLKPDFL